MKKEKQNYNFELSPEDIDLRDDFSEKWCGYVYKRKRMKTWDTPMTQEERNNLGYDTMNFEMVDVEVD